MTVQFAEWMPGEAERQTGHAFVKYLFLLQHVPGMNVTYNYIIKNMFCYNSSLWKAKRKRNGAKNIFQMPSEVTAANLRNSS